MDAVEPFEVLAALAERSVAVARGLPARLEIKPHWSGVGFSLLGGRMVAPMGEVAEMLSVPPYTRLPGVKPWILGVANVRGRLMPLVDLELFLGGQVTGGRRQRRVLVLDQGELYTGLVVNEVFGMQHFPIDAYGNDGAPASEALAAYEAGAFENEGVRWGVFHPSRLVQNEEFMNASAAV